MAKGLTELKWQKVKAPESMVGRPTSKVMNELAEAIKGLKDGDALLLKGEGRRAVAIRYAMKRRHLPVVCRVRDGDLYVCAAPNGQEKRTP